MQETEDKGPVTLTLPAPMPLACPSPTVSPALMVQQKKLTWERALPYIHFSVYNLLSHLGIILVYPFSKYSLSTKYEVLTLVVQIQRKIQQKINFHKNTLLS